MFSCPKKVEKTTPKSCILMAVGRFFFSAAQNSPELHFRFINSFIQLSLLRSLVSPLLLQTKHIIQCCSLIFFLEQGKTHFLRAFSTNCMLGQFVEKFPQKMCFTYFVNINQTCKFYTFLHYFLLFYISIFYIYILFLQFYPIFQ